MEFKPTIGFIGIGIMGRPMARNLQRAGYPLVVSTRTRGTAEALLADGARWSDAPNEVAQQSEIVILMLPDPQTVEQVALGANGVLEGARAGTVVIDMGTTRPQLARQMAQVGQARGVDVLDAPVSGGEVGAQNATLSIMVGGSAAAFARVLPILQVLGSRVIHVGDAGAGQIAKACNQVVVGLTIQAVAEALAVAQRAGVDVVRVRDALLGGFAASRVLELHGQRMIQGNFKAGARVRTHHKDLQIALELAEDCGVTLPITRQVDEMFEQLIRAGFGDDDHAALYRIVGKV